MLDAEQRLLTQCWFGPQQVVLPQQVSPTLHEPLSPHVNHCRPKIARRRRGLWPQRQKSDWQVGYHTFDALQRPMEHFWFWLQQAVLPQQTWFCLHTFLPQQVLPLVVQKGCEVVEQHVWLFPQEEFAREFRHLSDILESWRYEMLAQAHRWPDAALVREGLQVLQALANPLPTDILLATDLHAASVLRSEREPWLVIDRRHSSEMHPMTLGSASLQLRSAASCRPIGMVKRLSGLAEVDAERLQLWTFARVAVDPRPEWSQYAMGRYRQGIGSGEMFADGILIMILGSMLNTCELSPHRCVYGSAFLREGG
jgi:hypothetical protein